MKKTILDSISSHVWLGLLNSECADCSIRTYCHDLASPRGLVWIDGLEMDVLNDIKIDSGLKIRSEEGCTRYENDYSGIVTSILCEDEVRVLCQSNGDDDDNGLIPDPNFPSLIAKAVACNPNRGT